jgi:hypothetical protein
LRDTDRLFAVACFGYDGDIVGIFQHATEAAPNQAVVVHQEY